MDRRKRWKGEHILYFSLITKSSQLFCHLNWGDKIEPSSKCQECHQAILSVSVKDDKWFSVTSYFRYSRYEKNLIDAKNFGVKKAISTNVAMGLTQFVIFGTYALAFWYGTKLSVDEPENYSIGKVLTVSL